MWSASPGCDVADSSAGSQPKANASVRAACRHPAYGGGSGRGAPRRRPRRRRRGPASAGRRRARRRPGVPKTPWPWTAQGLQRPPRGRRTRTCPRRRRAAARPPRGRPRRGQHQVGAAPEHAERAAAELAAGQLRGPGQLVRDGRRGHHQRVAVGVVPSGEALRDQQPGGADRDVGLPGAPGPAGGVGDDHADVGGRRPRCRRGSGGPRRRGRRGAGRRGPAATLEASMPAAAMVRPWWVRTIVVGPRRATTRAVSAASAVSRSPSRTWPSALLTTLLVTATTSPSASVAVPQDQRREVVARARPRRSPPGASDLETARAGHATRSSAAAAIAAVASWSVIIRGTARHAMPSASTRGDLARRRSRRPASRRGSRRRSGRRSARPPRPR